MKNKENILPEDFYKKNLFYDCGDKSMKARLGFLPCSIWKPDVKITKYLKNIIVRYCLIRELINLSSFFAYIIPLEVSYMKEFIIRKKEGNMYSNL